MLSFLWTAEEIEIYLNGAKNLLSSNTVEGVEEYDLLQKCECLLLYLRSLAFSRKSVEDKHILTKLNAIIYRLFRKWECYT